jgi:hypothetical protein
MTEVVPNKTYTMAVKRIVDFFSDTEWQERFDALVWAAIESKSRPASDVLTCSQHRWEIIRKIKQGLPLDEGDKSFLLNLAMFPHRYVNNSRKTEVPKSFRGEVSFAVAMAHSVGLSIFRNDASSAISACDAVGDAFRTLGFKPTSYSRVKALYLESELKIKK